jgi:SAM-dependent methyltransferase
MKQMNTLGSIALCEICASVDFVELWQKDGENYQRCINCGLVRIFPQPSDERLTRIYDEDYACIWGKDEQEIVFKYLKHKLGLLVLRPLLDFVQRERGEKERGNLLDIGAGSGMLMETAAELGYEAYGVECGGASIKNLQRKFGRDRIFAGWLEAVDFESLGKTDFFDAITMVDVLEHSRNPNLILDVANKLLKTEGIVSCYVPTTSSLAAKLMGKRWDSYCTMHTFSFSNENLRTLFIQHGFDILSIDSAPRFLTIEYARLVARHLLHGGIVEKLLPVLDIVPRFLARIILPVYCGQVLIIARKTRNLPVEAHQTNMR